MKPSWTRIDGTPNYTWNGWKAVYVKTIKGYPCYNTYRPDGTMYGIGGLPRKVS